MHGSRKFSQEVLTEFCHCKTHTRVAPTRFCHCKTHTHINQGKGGGGSDPLSPLWIGAWTYIFSMQIVKTDNCSEEVLGAHATWPVSLWCGSFVYRLVFVTILFVHTYMFKFLCINLNCSGITC